MHNKRPGKLVVSYQYSESNYCMSLYRNGSPCTLQDLGAGMLAHEATSIAMEVILSSMFPLDEVRQMIHL